MEDKVEKKLPRPIPVTADSAQGRSGRIIKRRDDRRGLRPERN